MKGTNHININYETTLEALQEYFDKRLVDKPVVTSINLNGACWMDMAGDIRSVPGEIKVRVVDNETFMGLKS